MSRAQLTTSSEKTIEVRANDGTLIVCDLLEADREDTILVVPGFWRTRKHPIIRAITSSLHDAGLTVCVADNRGHGDSSGTFGFDTKEAGDIDDVISALVDRDLGRKGICLLGFSAGGAISISTTAVRREGVRGLILISPVAEFKKVIPRPNPFALHRQLSFANAIHPPRFWWYEQSRRDPLADADEVSVPTCLVHARNDWLVHHSHSIRLAERLRGKTETHILEIDRVHAERMFSTSTEPWNIITGFMIESLGMNVSGN